VQILPVETSAIVAATAPDVMARAAAITIRMWHELADEASRALLFAEFTHKSRTLSLIEAVAASATVRGGGALPRAIASGLPHGLAEQAELLEPAFLRSLADNLGTLSTPAVLNAWKQAFRAFVLQGTR
jgi:hemoglobin-like flavoprotein